MRKTNLLLLIVMLLIMLLLNLPARAWTPNDPLRFSQWGLDAIGAYGAWDYQRGGRPDVKVAVIDTGVDWNLPEFAHTHFDRANAYDFINMDRIPDDLEGHGTHVTGTIAESTNDGIGCAGIAFNTTILPLKVSTWGYMDMDTVARAVNYAVDRGADVINMSLSSPYKSTSLERACWRAYNAGVFVAAASGNESYSFWTLSADYPAYHLSTMAVGAISSNKRRWYRSNRAYSYGWPGLVAPGDNIRQVIRGGGSDTLTGTSMATPHVSALAALILSEAYDRGIAIPGRSKARMDWIERIMFRTARDLGDSGWDWDYGAGLIQADAALRYMQGL